VKSQQRKVVAIFPDRTIEDFKNEEPEVFHALADSIMQLILSKISRDSDVGIQKEKSDKDTGGC